MGDYLEYTGTELVWHGKPEERYAASSGLGPDKARGTPDYRTPANQCVKDSGPVPEGTYYLRLTIDPKGSARDDGSGHCRLVASSLIQTIPRGDEAGECEPFWENWGWNRVRFEPADSTTKKACDGTRSGFYIHDSTKGFSHGCIEVDGRFFLRLHTFAKSSKGTKMGLVVKYTGKTTYGGTKK